MGFSHILWLLRTPPIHRIHTLLMYLMLCTADNSFLEANLVQFWIILRKSENFVPMVAIAVRICLTCTSQRKKKYQPREFKFQGGSFIYSGSTKLFICPWYVSDLLYIIIIYFIPSSAGEPQLYIGTIFDTVFFFWYLLALSNKTNLSNTVNLTQLFSRMG